MNEIQQAERPRPFKIHREIGPEDRSWLSHRDNIQERIRDVAFDHDIEVVVPKNIWGLNLVHVSEVVAMQQTVPFKKEELDPLFEPLKLHKQTTLDQITGSTASNRLRLLTVGASTGGEEFSDHIIGLELTDPNFVKLWKKEREMALISLKVLINEKRKTAQLDAGDGNDDVRIITPEVPLLCLAFVEGLPVDTASEERDIVARFAGEIGVITATVGRLGFFEAKLSEKGVMGWQQTMR